MPSRNALLLAVLVSLAVSEARSQGPDVMIGDLNGIDSYGTDAGIIYSYAVGTTACNVGNQVLNWWGATNQHPVIGQNIYRLKAGRFELIGMSWVKHGFGAAAGSYCAPCQDPGNGQLLGVGCSDPYGSSTNGVQSGLGPRSEINASTGYFPYPVIGSYPPAAPTIGRRIQCQAADINPALNAGATYYAEGQYVTPDDAAAGHQNNNASYRPLTFAAGSFAASFIAPTVQQQPAILAWQAADPSVAIQYVDFPNDGRFIVAKKVTSLGGGSWHYEIAAHNLTSDRSARGFMVDLPAGTTITNPGFKDVAYHSGEPISGADWTITINGASINWATELFSANPNANALRWGTLYNFWFDATASSETNKSIELFKPEPCLPDPAVPSSVAYVLNTAAPFDSPVITGSSGPSGDDSALNVPIGFPFTFWGTTYSTVWISTNGFLAFDAAGTIEWTNQCIPAPAVPNGFIAGFWDDLNPSPGQIRYATIGTAPNRRFVVHWNGVPLITNASSLHNFKLILDETSNLITSTVISAATGGSSATLGIERQDGATGVQGSCNTAGSAQPNTTWTYAPVTQILPSADLAVTGSTGPSGTLTWSINSNANAAPVVLIASLDPGPTSLGSLGTLGLGFTPGQFVVLADGLGAFGPAVPADVTDPSCGLFQLSITLGPAGLPPGLSIYNQGGVISTTTVPPPPNGAFHITDLVTLNT